MFLSDFSTQISKNTFKIFSFIPLAKLRASQLNFFFILHPFPLPTISICCVPASLNQFQQFYGREQERMDGWREAPPKHFWQNCRSSTEKLESTVGSVDFFFILASSFRNFHQLAKSDFQLVKFTFLFGIIRIFNSPSPASKKQQIFWYSSSPNWEKVENTTCKTHLSES